MTFSSRCRGLLLTPLGIRASIMVGFQMEPRQRLAGITEALCQDVITDA